VGLHLIFAIYIDSYFVLSLDFFGSLSIILNAPFFNINLIERKIALILNSNTFAQRNYLSLAG
jgi:hypothetical protein